MLILKSLKLSMIIWTWKFTVIIDGTNTFFTWRKNHLSFFRLHSIWYPYYLYHLYPNENGIQFSWLQNKFYVFFDCIRERAKMFDQGGRKLLQFGRCYPILSLLQWIVFCWIWESRFRYASSVFSAEHIRLCPTGQLSGPCMSRKIHFSAVLSVCGTFFFPPLKYFP